MKKIVLLLTFLCSINGFSQAFNSYQYLVIPSKFAFQKQENQYGLNALVEAYFKQQGYTVLYDKDLTKEMTSNPCNAIYANVLRENNMFNTKITVQLKDCQGKQLLVSSEGSSRAKEYDVAHKEAIRMALKSIRNQNYVFEQDIKKSILNTERQPTEANITKVEQVKTEKDNASSNKDLLIVETLTNGYLLIDSVTSKVFLKLYSTSSKDIFIAVSNTKNGIVFKSLDNVLFEYVVDNVVKRDILNVKF